MQFKKKTKHYQSIIMFIITLKPLFLFCVSSKHDYTKTFISLPLPPPAHTHFLLDFVSIKWRIAVYFFFLSFSLSSLGGIQFGLPNTSLTLCSCLTNLEMCLSSLLLLQPRRRRQRWWRLHFIKSPFIKPQG